MNSGKTFLSTVVIFLSMTSFSSVKAQQNRVNQCLNYHRQQTIKLQGEAIEKTRWYKDRRVGFDDWRDPNFYSFTIREDHQVEFLEDRRADIRYYTNGIYYLVSVEPTLEVPKYSEQEITTRCQQNI